MNKISNKESQDTGTSKKITELPFFKKIKKKIEFEIKTNQIRKSIISQQEPNSQMQDDDFMPKNTNLSEEEDLPSFGHSFKKQSNNLNNTLKSQPV